MQWLKITIILLPFMISLSQEVGKGSFEQFQFRVYPEVAGQIVIPLKKWLKRKRPGNSLSRWPARHLPSSVMSELPFTVWIVGLPPNMAASTLMDFVPLGNRSNTAEHNVGTRVCKLCTSPSLPVIDYKLNCKSCFMHFLISHHCFGRAS